MKLKQILILISTVIQLLFKTRKEAITMHYTFWLRDFAKIFENRGNEFHACFDDEVYNLIKPFLFYIIVM